MANDGITAGARRPEEFVGFDCEFLRCEEIQAAGDLVAPDARENPVSAS